MDSDIAVQLAADILEDHFGDAAKRVGTVLIERGQLNLQSIVRFVNQDCDVDEEELRFVDVRNTLLTFVQHGLVTVKSSLPSEADSTRAVAQLYSMGLDEVLSRLRFSHYAEYVLWVFGEIAWQLVCVVLTYGRSSRSFMVEEVQRRMKDASLEDINTDLQGLLDVGLLSPVSPFIALDAAAGSGAGSRAVKEEQDKEGGPPLRPAKLRKLSAGVQQAPQKPAQDNVYTFNRSVFNLCLVKNLLCRLIEERTNQQFAGKVLAALLTAVRPAANGQRVESDYMTLKDIEAMMRDMGYIDVNGSRAKSDADRLIHYLTLLGPPDSRDGRGEEEGARLLKRKVVRSVSNASGRAVPLEEAAWAVDWTYANKTLTNAVTAHLIRDQFGTNGFRMFNLLNEQPVPQKIEETQIFQMCMVPVPAGRELLHQMTRRHIIQWQEVAKTQASRGPDFNSFWLYYVDRQHVHMAILHDVFQAILNLRIRFRTEVQKTVHLEGRPKSLTSGERAILLASYRSQDVLERSFLVLDSVLLVFRHFAGAK